MFGVVELECNKPYRLRLAGKNARAHEFTGAFVKITPEMMLKVMMDTKTNKPGIIDIWIEVWDQENRCARPVEIRGRQ